MRPIVGIECDHVEERRSYAKLYAAYVDAVWSAGGLPVLIPALAHRGYADELLQRLDALVLTGGDDIEAAEFGQDPHPSTVLVARCRYDLGRTLWRGCRDRGLPVLGICYGMQLVNVACGGDLVQDLSLSGSGSTSHLAIAEDGRRVSVPHSLEIEGDSLLAGIVGAGPCQVSSLHHQAVGRLGDGVRAVAHAPDGVVEAMELAGDGGWFLGVQWHPELMPEAAAGLGLFQALVAEASRLGGTRRSLELPPPLSGETR